jgi:gamma-butyrobetaine dioxygenase
MEIMALVQAAEVTGRRVAVRWREGGGAEFPFLWLRDNCRCAQCRHPGNGQRLLDTLDIPEDIAPKIVAAKGEALEIGWSDGHDSRYAADWLKAHELSPQARARRRPQHRIWGNEIANDLPRADWNELDRSAEAERAFLARYHAYGFGLLDNVPVRSGMVVDAGNRFGHVRVTNYGAYFDVKSIPNPNNLAYTSVGLGVHTDNPYRDPSPGIQLLHCLEADAPGGESILVDGFKAAEDLRRDDPAAFERLSKLPQHFHFSDKNADLEADQRVIHTDHEGIVRSVHFNNRSAAPIDLPLEEIEGWYAAYRRFARLLRRPEGELRFRLAPGQLLMFQNDRVLHGRDGFDPNQGRRHLQGCYIDQDGILSRWRVLERGSAAEMRA